MSSSTAPENPKEDFKAAVKRCGYNDATVTYIIEQGFDDAQSFMTVAVHQVPSMLKMMAKTPPENGAFPFSANLQLHGFRMWLEYRLSRGQALKVSLFSDPPLIKKWTKRTQELFALNKEVASDELTPPKELTSFTQWEVFNDALLTFLAQHCNPTTGVPLTYVLRETKPVGSEARNAAYDTIDDDLIATTILQGDQYALDNQRVFTLMKPFLVGGPGLTFIKPHQKKKDGREAYLALTRQATGTAAVTIRKKEAYAAIADAKFTVRGRFSYQQYVHRHQKAHNTLAELDEPVAETKKVTDFLKGISDPSLAAGKTVVNGDAAKLSDFEACQQYFGTLIAASRTDKTNDENRKIAGVGTTKTSGKKNGRYKQNKKKTRHYSLDEWRKLSDEEKAEILRARKEQKDKEQKDANGKRKAGAVRTEDENGSRKLSKTETPKSDDMKLETTDLDGDDAPNYSEPDPPVADEPTVPKTSAGNSFGRFAHSKKGSTKPHNPDETKEPTTAVAKAALADKATKQT